MFSISLTKFVISLYTLRGVSGANTSLDLCSVVRRLGEHAEVSYPCVRHADRLSVEACVQAEPRGGKPDVPVLPR